MYSWINELQFLWMVVFGMDTIVEIQSQNKMRIIGLKSVFVISRMIRQLMRCS